MTKDINLKKKRKRVPRSVTEERESIKKFAYQLTYIKSSSTTTTTASASCV
jgi:hypothetical protein